MSDRLQFNLDHALPADLQQIVEQVEKTAATHRGDSLALLRLLRLLESLHRDIRETLFREALPTNRQRLYAFLRDIEVHGGWPYIQRMKLRSLLEAFLETEAAEEESTISE